MTLVSETLFALYPLFAFTPIASGGLGLSEAQIGAHTAMRSVLSILVLFAYAPVCARLGGTVRCYQVGMVLWPFAIAGLPVLNALARTDAGPDENDVGSWVFNGVLLMVFATWSLACLAWRKCSTVILLPNSIDIKISERANRGH